MHFSQLEKIHAIGTTNQIEGNNKLCDISKQTNQIKIVTIKFSVRFSLVNLETCYILTNLSTILRVWYYFIYIFWFQYFYDFNVIKYMHHKIDTIESNV
jgi:hypothetical protein